MIVITACWYRIHVPEKHQTLKYYFKIYIKSLVASLAGDIFDCSSLSETSCWVGHKNIAHPEKMLLCVYCARNKYHLRYVTKL